jgi:peptidoglycan/LPS O-acetylase OafA/YrhL
MFHVFHSFFGNWQPHPEAFGFGWVIEGHTGVSLFFVLSGYLFMNIALRADGKLDYGRFLRNRTLRIFPLFIVVFAVAVSINRDAFRPQDALYLLFSNLGDAPTSKQFMTGAAWTISVEFTFYLAFPFLARFALMQGPGYLVRLTGLILLFKLGAFLISDRPTHMIYSTLLGRFDQFLIGMLAAQLAAYHLDVKLHGVWTLIAGFSVWGLLEAQAHWASFFLPQPAQSAWLAWPTVEAMAWATLIVSYAHWRGTLWDWLGRMLERGGEISFSLYLWHGLVIYLGIRLIGTPSWFESRILNVLAVTGGVLTASWWVASLSYRTIEAPFLELRGRYVK